MLFEPPEALFLLLINSVHLTNFLLHMVLKKILGDIIVFNEDLMNLREILINLLVFLRYKLVVIFHLLFDAHHHSFLFHHNVYFPLILPMDKILELDNRIFMLFRMLFIHALVTHKSIVTIYSLTNQMNNSIVSLTNCLFF